MKPRPVLAMLLCLAIFLIWTSRSSRLQRERQEAARQEAVPQAPAGGDVKDPVAAGEGAAGAAGDDAPGVVRPRREAARAELAGEPHLRASTSSHGLERLTLLEYNDNVDHDRPLDLIDPMSDRAQPLALRVERIEGVDTSTEELPELEFEEWDLETRDAQTVRLRNELDEGGGTGDGTGVEIVEEVRLPAGGWHLDVAVTLTNHGAGPRRIQYRLWGPGGLPSESRRAPGSDLRVVIGSLTAAGVAAGSLHEVADIADLGVWEYSNRPCFVGLENNYFLSVIAAVDENGRPAETIDKIFAETFKDVEAQAAAMFPGRRLDDLNATERQEVQKSAYPTAQVGIRSKSFELAPGASVTHRYLLYAGPRKDAVLKQPEYAQLNLTSVNDYGMTGWLVHLFLAILQGFHWVTGSWGLAIICLTLVVRTSLHPINKRQQLGMSRYQKKMQRIQPQIKELQKKFEKDRMKMHQEMQKLMKEHDISHGQMMGGCLMILLQLPIWIGLINTLDYSIDLRQAAFLWIPDLSQPDHLYRFGGQVPLVPEFLNILPLCYVVLMLVNQKMLPKPDDPQAQQTQRMMSFVMIAFGFFFYSFPSGLMVYFIASAIFGIFESRMIRRIIETKDAVAGAGAALPAGATSAGATSAGAPAAAPYASSRVGPRRKPTKAERQRQKGQRY